ncbi:MAG TPA: hypothetical protein VEG28_05345 [Dehalococcoidia bacterium]|nr:hypothetical protein [Dehalococcoidia bacterium]
MPKRSRKKHPRDINALAASIVAQSTGQPIPDLSQPQKNPHAVALGSLGGKKGGKARFAKLTPEQRTEIAKKAAQARWAKHE